VAFCIEILRVLQAEGILHRRRMLHTHEVVVPHAITWDHKEAEEDVRQEHLHLLSVRGKVPSRVCLGYVLVAFTPCEPCRRESERSERARTGRKTACSDDSLVGDPLLVVCQDVRMERYISRHEVWLLIGLRVDPAERLQVT